MPLASHHERLSHLPLQVIFWWIVIVTAVSSCCLHTLTHHIKQEIRDCYRPEFTNLTSALICLEDFCSPRKEHIKVQDVHPRCKNIERVSRLSSNLNNLHSSSERQLGHSLGTTVTQKSHRRDKSGSVLPISKVKPYNRSGSITVFYDGGSDATYITHKMVHKLNAKKVVGPIGLGITTMGSSQTQYSTDIYEVDLCSVTGGKVTVRAYGIDTIIGPVSQLDYTLLQTLFPDVDISTVSRGSQVDMLLGVDYFGNHPKSEIVKAGDHLSIMRGVLGDCLQGSHPELVCDTKYSKKIKLKDKDSLLKQQFDMDITMIPS